MRTICQAMLSSAEKAVDSLCSAAVQRVALGMLFFAAPATIAMANDIPSLPYIYPFIADVSAVNTEREWRAPELTSGWGEIGPSFDLEDVLSAAYPNAASGGTSHVKQRVIFRGSTLFVEREIEFKWVNQHVGSNLGWPSLSANTSMAIYTSQPNVPYTWRFSGGSVQYTSLIEGNGPEAYVAWDLFAGLPQMGRSYTTTNTAPVVVSGTSASRPDKTIEYEGQTLYRANFGSFPEDVRGTFMQIEQNSSDGPTTHWGILKHSFQVDVRIEIGEAPVLTPTPTPTPAPPQGFPGGGMMFYASHFSVHAYDPDNLPLIASALASDGSEAMLDGLTLEETSGIGILDYMWTATGNATIIGDGTANALIGWEQPGTYTVNVTIWDDEGWQAQHSWSVNVVPEPSGLATVIIGLLIFGRRKASRNRV